MEIFHTEKPFLLTGDGKTLTPEAEARKMVAEDQLVHEQCDERTDAKRAKGLARRRRLHFGSEQRGASVSRRRSCGRGGVGVTGAVLCF